MLEAFYRLTIPELQGVHILPREAGEARTGEQSTTCCYERVRRWSQSSLLRDS
jgi:hypothetical protein